MTLKAITPSEMTQAAEHRGFLKPEDVLNTVRAILTNDFLRGHSIVFDPHGSFYTFQFETPLGSDTASIVTELLHQAGWAKAVFFMSGGKHCLHLYEFYEGSPAQTPV